MACELKIMVVAAEASGDMLGEGLIKQLQLQSPKPLSFFGVGGMRMKALGIDSPFDISEMSILGMIEGLKAYKRVKKRVDETVALAIKQRPDVVILIDSWGFTLRVAHGIRAAMPDVPLIKYVGPQVWATRPGRAKTLAQSVDLLLALHKIDAPYFERYGLKTVVVGNPALNLDFSQIKGAQFRKDHGFDHDMVLVLPGSRPSEIKRLMPVFIETMQGLQNQRPQIGFVMPVADTVKDLVHSYINQLHLNLYLIDNENEKLSAMTSADVALACSGTVSTELALAGCPMVIAYKVEPLTSFIFKHISPLKHVTLFNIMAQKEVAPEFIQENCTAQKLIAALEKRLDDKVFRDNQREEQFKALDQMGRGQKPPAVIAAKAVIEHLKLQ